jgi:CHRD domain
MKKWTASSFFIAITILIGSADFAASQNPGMGMQMASHTLLLAQLDAKQVVGGSSSSATGTGAFLLDPAHRTVQYNLTYQGLESGGAKSIGLYNFGAGKNGEPVKLLCGADAQPCPSGNSATISGSFERGDRGAIDNHLISEFDSERVYVEIVGGNGKPEIRGQLGPNLAMVRVENYVARLGPAAGVDSKGNGTAVVSETYLPSGKTSVFYAATVAGTSGAPVNAELVSGAGPAVPAFNSKLALPQLKLNLSRDRETGGSLSGSYQVNSASPDALLATALAQKGNGQSSFVVTTSRYPNGELYGALVPVR